MTHFYITELPLSGLKHIQRKSLGDDRGFFSRIFCADELSEAGWRKPVVQINHTFTSRRGTVRGMHYQQPPDAEMKLVSCLRGEVWDVAVDLRAGSPTFLKWHAEIISAENCRAMLIPEGFAHGFQTLVDDVVLLYCHSAFHVQNLEGGIDPLDKRVGIAWPEPISRLSDRDRNHAPLDGGFEGLIL